MKPLKLAEDLWLIDLAVYLPGPRALVIADLHLGYEEALRCEGVSLPPGHLRKVEERLVRILNRLEEGGKPERLIINGDLKHRFAPLSRYEEHETAALLYFLAARFAEMTLLRGNHDTNIAGLMKLNRRLRVQEALVVNDLLIIHGDREPRREELAGAEVILIGHDHPAVGLRSGTGRLETYKAFLLGEYHDRKLLVQPSFNLLVRGSDLSSERALSPLLSEERLKSFSVYPVSDEGEIYPLGPLASLLQL
jgi:putative SbcD/Mre11-related phosphoesterase